MEGELLADQPLGQKLIKKWFWLYFFMIITAPVGYIIKMIVSNTLSVEDVGIFYSVLGLIWLISIYHDLWLTEALQYFLPKYWIEKKYDSFKTITVITLIAQVTIGIGIACLIYFGADRLAVNHFRSVEAAGIIKTLAFYFIWINFLQVFWSIFISFQDTVSYNLLDFFRSYAILIFTVIFWTGHTLTATNFALGWISWLGIALLAGTIILWKKYGHTLKKGSLVRDTALIKKQFKYALRVFLWANIGNLLGQIDQQMIINILWPKAAGYYSNFFSLLLTYSLVVTPILTLTFPIVTELITKNDHEKFKEFQNILYKYFSVFALSIGWIFFAFWPEIASIFFGTKFIYSGQLLVYAAPFLILNVLYIINFGILAWLGKVRQRVQVLLVALLANILINFLLLYVFKVGLPWAVIAMIIGRVLLRWGSFRIVQKYQKIWFDWMFLLKNTGVIVILSAVYFLCKDHIMINDNSYRWYNIMYFTIALLLYYWVIWGFNYKSIWFLIKEIKSFRKIG